MKYRYENILQRLKFEAPIYLLGLGIVLVVDAIGKFEIPFGPGKFIIFPLFFAIIIGILTGPSVLKIMHKERVFAASGLIVVGIGPLIARIGIAAGKDIMTVIEAGPALLMQEFGNLFTIFLALPLAILLGLKRESIGATHSINRETNLALVNDLYGAHSAEAHGALGVYIVGGLFGTIFFGFMVSILAATGWFHPLALGMSSGVGAFIMMSTGVVTLGETFPEFAQQIEVLAGMSETLSGVTGIYMALFIGLPLATKLYNTLEPKMRKISLKPVKINDQERETDPLPQGARLSEYAMVITISIIAITMSNTLFYKVDFLTSFKGATILGGITWLGFVAKRFIPLKKLPVVAYCAIIGLLLALPVSPVAKYITFIVEYGKGINFLAPLSIVGVYAGISISNTLKLFAKQSWRIIIVACFVMLGTYVGSAIIAQIMLSITGQI